MYILWTNYMMIDHTCRQWLRVTRSSASLAQSEALERVTWIILITLFIFLYKNNKQKIMEVDPFHF